MSISSCVQQVNRRPFVRAVLGFVAIITTMFNFSLGVNVLSRNNSSLNFEANNISATLINSNFGARIELLSSELKQAKSITVSNESIRKKLPPDISIAQHNQEANETSLKITSKNNQQQNKLAKKQQQHRQGREEPIEMSESKKVELNSNCALVLKRTYIIDKRLDDRWGERFVFNDIDVDDLKK